MSSLMDAFAEKIFDYIRMQHGKNVLKHVQSNKNKKFVVKLLELALRNREDVEHAANKIISTLKTNGAL